jgi:hypothetical protein
MTPIVTSCARLDSRSNWMNLESIGGRVSVRCCYTTSRVVVRHPEGSNR